MKLTKAQHIVALLMLIPVVPLALPLWALTKLFRMASDTCEAMDELACVPFMAAHRAWVHRCERVNAGRAALAGEGK